MATLNGWGPLRLSYPTHYGISSSNVPWQKLAWLS